MKLHSIKILSLWRKADSAPQDGSLILADFQDAITAKRVVWNYMIKCWVEKSQTKSHPETFFQRNMIRWKKVATQQKRGNNRMKPTATLINQEKS